MAVKGSSTAARVLEVFEAVAAHQPVGVAALSRLLDVDKSAVQRALVTLSERGWIQSDGSARWETSPLILSLAYGSRAKVELRQRIQPVLEQLAVETGETAIFNEPAGSTLVVSQVAESQQPLRMAPRIGAVVPARDSATGRVLLPYLSRERQVELLGDAPDAELLAVLDASRTRGYAASSEVNAPAMTIAAAVFDIEGRPLGAVAITGPIHRMPPDTHAQFAEAVCQAANLLSYGLPSAEPKEVHLVRIDDRRDQSG